MPSGSELFWNKVDFLTDDPWGRWLWTGAEYKGYGRLTRDGRTWKAHHYAMHLAGVEGALGEHVDHLCRVSLCVNPRHLEWVTQAENNRRMVACRERVTECSRHSDPTRWKRNRGQFVCMDCGVENTRRYRERKAVAA